MFEEYWARCGKNILDGFPAEVHAALKVHMEAVWHDAFNVAIGRAVTTLWGEARKASKSGDADLAKRIRRACVPMAEMNL